MATKTALVLETNPVITERYLNYTHDSSWRIMLKDTLNGFLEKLQHEKFNLIVAEESIVQQGIISMLKSTGTPLLLATNTKNPQIQTLPRNFNRTELLTVFDRLVPDSAVKNDLPDSSEDEDNTVTELLAGLEDEEEPFELSSDAVIAEPKAPQNEEADIDDLFSDNSAETDLFGDFPNEENGLSGSGNDAEIQPQPQETPAPETAQEPAAEPEKPEPETMENKETVFQAPPSFEDFNGNMSGIDDFVSSLSLERNNEKEEEEESRPFVTPAPAEEPTYDKPQAQAAIPDESAVKAAVFEWMEKNARSIIKETVLEQLASLSGKNND